MRCDILAQGVVDAAKEININIPLVVRLAGTNFKEGKEILDNSGLKIIFTTALAAIASLGVSSTVHSQACPNLDFEVLPFCCKSMAPAIATLCKAPMI